MLTGGKDQDLITGDAGADIFRFESLDGSIDTITDFSTATRDKIEISASFGGGTTVGVLDQSQFTIGSSASTTDHRLIYNDRTGGLFFDADGVGGENQVQFAILAELTSDDIFVI